MAKPKQIASPKTESGNDQLTPMPQSQKVIVCFTEGNAFGFYEIEIDKLLLEKHGRVTGKMTPDFTQYAEPQLIRKARQHWGL